MKIKHLLLLAIMLICSSVIAQEYHYPYNGGYENTFLFRAKVYVDGVEQTATDNTIEVGAFNGDQVRGHAFVSLYNNQYIVVNLSVGANSGENYNCTFKLYNHTTNKEYVVYTVQDNNGNLVGSVAGVVNAKYGTVKSPYALYFSTATTLTVSPYANAQGHDGWHLIASPLAGTGVAPTAVTNMTTGSYDLYYFDQVGTGNGKEWKNYKATTFNLVPGKGYLYANSVQTDLQFIGTVYSGDGEFDLEYVAGESCAHANLSGYNLMGNPFTTEAAVEDGNGTAKAFYRMNEAGSDLVSVASGSADRMEGIFVVATSATDKVKFVPGSKATRSIDQVNLNLVRNDNKTIDNVIVRFDGGEVLPKYAMHDDSPIIYVPQGGKDYSIVKGSVTSVFPVNFKTSSFGTYTLRADLASAGVSYMHLIDKLTGEDIDMLLEGEYTFIGAPTDNADRFILRLSYSGNFDDNNSIFAYQNGTDIIICGDGTLQVFDVMGRFVSSQEIHGVQAIQALPMGVYIFRMVGEEIQTQKIYVR